MRRNFRRVRTSLTVGRPIRKRRARAVSEGIRLPERYSPVRMRSSRRSASWWYRGSGDSGLRAADTGDSSGSSVAGSAQVVKTTYPIGSDSSDEETARRPRGPGVVFEMGQHTAEAVGSLGGAGFTT